MLLHVLLGLLNGMVVGTSRAFNGQLSTVVGPFRASLWNHAVGFVFLTAVLLVTGEWGGGGGTAPWFAYLGGAVGALFVAVNSYVFPRLGAMSGAVLVISGQMIFAVVLDTLNRGALPSALQCVGVVIVLLGMSARRISSLLARRPGPPGAPPPDGAAGTPIAPGSRP